MTVPFPLGASHGLPITLSRIDGLGEPLHSAGPHAHAFFSLMYVNDGRGTMVSGSETVDVGDGSLTLIPPRAIHDATRLRAVDRWAMGFTPDLFGPEGAGWIFPRPSRPEWIALMHRSVAPPPPIVVPACDRPGWRDTLARIERELRERPRGFRDVVRACLRILLIEAARLLSAPGDPEPVSPLLEEVFDVIESGFAAGLSLADVARAVGRSPAHLTTLVRRETGLTVQQWIIERRMAEARQRLCGSDENVTVVAERAGYADPALFIRQFKRAHGLTPRAWRLGAASCRFEK